MGEEEHDIDHNVAPIGEGIGVAVEVGRGEAVDHDRTECEGRGQSQPEVRIDHHEKAGERHSPHRLEDLVPPPIRPVVTE